MATFPLRSRHNAERRVTKKVRARLAEAEKKTSLADGLDQRGSRYLTVMQLLSRDGDNCYLCTAPLETGRFDVDHIIPRSRGGSDHLLNLALACSRCNRRKHDLIVAFDIADRRPVFRLP